MSTRFSVVSRHLPQAEGSAAGRVLRATCEGLQQLGHQVDLTCWGPEPPDEPLPSWCAWEPLAAEAAWRTRGRALLRPRWDAARLAWQPEPGGVAIADDPLSFAAVASAPAPVVTMHFATALDAATRRRSPRDLQDVRAERRAVREASRVWAYSARVAAALGRPAQVLPIAWPVPAVALPPAERPTAGLLADWRWPPNARARDLLLSLWDDVRARVPGAELVLAGRGPRVAGRPSGVVELGEVAASTELLSRVAVIAFPCPASSGPKTKVLEALAHGRPVVTSRWGAEGIGEQRPDGRRAYDAALRVGRDRSELVELLVGALSDLSATSAAGAQGRAAVTADHSPAVAAAARLRALP